MKKKLVVPIPSRNRRGFCPDINHSPWRADNATEINPELAMFSGLCILTGGTKPVLSSHFPGFRNP